MNPTGLLVLYCVAILLASMAGGWLPLVLRPTHIRLQTYLSFASGAMLGAALCHMLPEATRLAPDSWFHWTLLGLLALFFLERFFAFHHHEMPDDPEEPGGRAAGPDGAASCRHDELAHAHPSSSARDRESRLNWGAALVGLSLHTLAGGFALASAAAAQSDKRTWVGLSVFLATLLHKPADSLTITSLMLTGGARRQSAHVVNFCFALVIPLGVLLYFVAQSVASIGQAGFSGAALAFSAGTFLSIALGDLMPELQFHRHDRVKLSAALLAGVAVMVASALLGG